MDAAIAHTTVQVNALTVVPHHVDMVALGAVVVVVLHHAEAVVHQVVLLLVELDVLAAVAVAALHHAEAVAHQVVLLLVELDVLVAVAVAVLHTVALLAAHNAQEHAVAVVICATTPVLVAMGHANNTVLAVQVPALDNATILARDIINRDREKYFTL